jgi:hypothetical protein
MERAVAGAQHTFAFLCDDPVFQSGTFSSDSSYVDLFELYWRKSKRKKKGLMYYNSLLYFHFFLRPFPFRIFATSELSPWHVRRLGTLRLPFPGPYILIMSFFLKKTNKNPDWDSALLSIG